MSLIHIYEPKRQYATSGLPSSDLYWGVGGGVGVGGGGWGEEGGLGGGVGGDRLLKGSYESTNSSLFSYKLRYHLTNTHQAFRV